MVEEGIRSSRIRTDHLCSRSIVKNRIPFSGWQSCKGSNTEAANRHSSLDDFLRNRSKGERERALGETLVLFIIIWWLVTQVVWYSSMCIGVSLNGGCKLVVEQAEGEKRKGVRSHLDLMPFPLLLPLVLISPPPAGWMDGKRRALL